MGILLYPYYLLLFWYKDVLYSCLKTSFQIILYTSDLLSLGVMIKTFFKPLKGEYREGLVFFSVIMGMIFKSILISIDLLLMLALISVLLVFNLTVILFPLLIIKILL